MSRVKTGWSCSIDLANSPFRSTPPDKIEDNREHYKIGDWVYHEKWGKGIVLYLEGDGDKMKVSVSFSGQKKKLLVKYAKLKKLSTKK